MISQTYYLQNSGLLTTGQGNRWQTVLVVDAGYEQVPVDTPAGEKQHAAISRVISENSQFCDIFFQLIGENMLVNSLDCIFRKIKTCFKLNQMFKQAASDVHYFR